MHTKLEAVTALLLTGVALGGIGPDSKPRAAGIPSAPPNSELRKFEGTVTAPVVYKDTMLVLVTKTGAAAVVFTKEIQGGVEYKYRYQSSDGKTQLSGDGKLSEKGGKKSDLFIEAGPIPLRWSYADKGKAWLYYDPSLLRVNLAGAADFENRKEPMPFGGPMPVKKLDLERFMQEPPANKRCE